MRKRLAIGAMAVAAVAVAGCSSSGSSHDTSAASTPSASGHAGAASSPRATTGPATGTAACNAINQTLNSIMGNAAKAKATGKLTVQEARQAKLASDLKENAGDFTDDQAQAGITPMLKQAEKTIAANVDSYYANYSEPNSGGYGLKIINALGQVKQECGTAPWQTAI